jgi:hypothetical protein
MQFINFKYCILQGAAVLATLLQRRVAQLDENGTIAMTVRDKVNKADRRQKPYENKLHEYHDRLDELGPYDAEI